MPNYGKISAAQVVLEILIPTAGVAPPPPAFGPLKITLRGVNRRVCQTGEAQGVAQVSSAPSIKRAV